MMAANTAGEVPELNDNPESVWPAWTFFSTREDHVEGPLSSWVCAQGRCRGSPGSSSMCWFRAYCHASHTKGSLIAFLTRVMALASSTSSTRPLS